MNYSHYTDRLMRPDVLSELKSAGNKFLSARALFIEHGILPTTLDRPANSVVHLITDQWTIDLQRGFTLLMTERYREDAKQFSQSVVNSEAGTDNNALP